MIWKNLGLPRNLILSKDDYLLDNKTIRKTFTGSNYTITSNPHGDTRNESMLIQAYYELCEYRANIQANYYQKTS